MTTNIILNPPIERLFIAPTNHRINQASLIAGLFLWALKMAYKFINNFETTLSSAITAAATSMTVANVAGLSLANGVVYRLTIQNADASLYELVDVTAISGNTLTIERGKESTTAQAWAVGSVVLCGVTAAQLSNEARKTVTSSTFTSRNGRKQQFVATANSTMNFAALNVNDYIDLIVNPATFTLTWIDVNWQNGTALQLTASKLNRVLIENDGGVLKAYIVSN